jgi:hypothetical protein
MILGHNQFIGVDHRSEERAWNKDVHFSNPSRILEIAQAASESGYRGMVIEPHPRMLDFLKLYDRHGTFEMKFYLQVPYIQGYVQRMGQSGIKGLVWDLIVKSRPSDLFGACVRSGIGVLRNEYLQLALSGLALEISQFKDFKIESVLLHNVATDLLLSLGLRGCLDDYIHFSHDVLGIQAGLVTLNFPLLASTLSDMSDSPPIIMTPINPAGFDMNPSKDAVEQALHAHKGEIIAMNVLGGGAFSISESASYIRSIPKVQSVVIGASTKEHLVECADFFGGEH